MVQGINLPDAQEQIATGHGGINDWDAPWLIQETELPYLENIEVNKVGLIEQRYGCYSYQCSSAASTSTWRPDGLIVFKDDDLQQEVLFRVYRGECDYFTGAPDLLGVGCGASFVPSLHGGAWGYRSGQDALYVSTFGKSDSSISLASALFMVTGTRSWTQAASMAPSYCSWWQYRLWCIDNKLGGDDQSLWWSELNDGLNYSLTNTVRVEPGRGGRLVAAVPLRAGSPTIICFKEKLTAAFTTFWGDSSSLIPQATDALDTVKSSIIVITDNVGCVAPLSIQPTPGSQFGEMIFLSHDGFRALTRSADDSISVPSLPISLKIRDIMGRLNYAHAHKVTSAVHENVYYAAVPLDGHTHNNYVLALDLVTGAWTVQKLVVATMASARLTETDDKLWLNYGDVTTDTTASGCSSGFQLFRYNYGFADPNNITPVPIDVQTRSFYFGDPYKRKAWRWVGVLVENSAATASFDVSIKDDGQAWTYVDTIHFPAEAGLDYVELGVDPLPWLGHVYKMSMKKVMLEDIEPGFMLQVRLTSATTSTNASHTHIGAIRIAAEVLDDQFDNAGI